MQQQTTTTCWRDEKMALVIKKLVLANISRHDRGKPARDLTAVDDSQRLLKLGKLINKTIHHARVV